MPYKDLEKRRAAVQKSKQKERMNPAYQECERETHRAYLRTMRTDSAYRETEKTYRQSYTQPAHSRPFVAIDGEGITRENGQHDYVFMQASTGESKRNLRGISTGQCFEFLLSLAQKYPNAIFCWFGSSYDLTKILTDIPESVLRDAQDSKGGESHMTQWIDERTGKQYAFSYRHRKSFTLHRYGKIRGELRTIHHHDGTVEQKWESTPEAKIIVYDVVGFFQGRFVDALEEWFADLLDKKTGIITFQDGIQVDVNAMRAMKNRRGTFTIDQLEREIAPYCKSETIALAHLMERVRDLLSNVGLTLSRWHGAGAAATSALAQHNIKGAMKERVPDGLLDAQRRAYAGGRIELGQIGTYVDRVYNYDITSAYPSAMLHLPTLTGGMWRHIRGKSERFYSLSHVRWHLDRTLPYYPFFYRDGNESIYFPSSGEGWYWKPEIDAALRAYEMGSLSTEREKGEISILESWEFQPATDAKPFAFIEDMFEHRKRLKAEKNPGEHVLKLTYNTFYGKNAQSVGGSEGKHPAYHNIGYAGFTTSWVRAKIFDAIMQAPESIIQIATDGIYSTVPLDVPLGENLGEWKLEKPLNGIIAVQAGIYWSLTELGREPLDSEKRSDDFAEKFLCYGKTWYAVNPHYRGYDSGALTPQMILDGWHTYHKHARRILNVPTTRFISLGSALASPDYWERRGTWYTIDRPLHLLPMGKRVLDQTNGKLPRIDRMMLMTKARLPECYDPHIRCVYDISYPYTLKWTRDAPMMMEDGIDSVVIDQEVEDSQI
jgi:hypothetical protein